MVSWCKGHHRSCYHGCSTQVSPWNTNLNNTPLERKGKHVVMSKQLEKNVASNEKHLMELELVDVTFARVIFCGFPHAGMSPISVGPITQHQFVKSI